jgi:hypothetical protein
MQNRTLRPYLAAMHRKPHFIDSWGSQKRAFEGGWAAVTAEYEIVSLFGSHQWDPHFSNDPGSQKRAFEEGWGAVIAKTVALDSSKVCNVTPRYAKLRAKDKKDIIGWENIELISDRPLVPSRVL